MEMPKSVQNVLRELENAGYEAWCVGGCVRDTLLGRTPGDWDVTTSALPEETMAVFAPHAFPTGLQHGTVTVRSEHESIEVTTYRVDGEYTDHRRPASVTFTRSLKEDLARRDFTVNAMAMDARGTLCDPFGGQEDLKNGILRCVGEPDKRFGEDALRILRGLRFAVVLDFAIEEETAAAIHRSREDLGSIAVERIAVELFKLLEGRAAARILREYPDVIGVFWPEILPMVGFEQRNPHHCYDVWEHTLHALDAVPQDGVLRCAMLLHDIGKPSCFTEDENGVGHFYGHAAVSEQLANAMLHRLKCGNELRERIVKLVAWHDRDIPRTDKAIRRALRQLGEEDLRRLLAVKRGDNLGQAAEYRGRQKEIDRGEEILNDLLAQNACFSLQQLAVNGHDMLTLGLTGPAIGRTLNALLDAVVNGDVPNEREELVKKVKEFVTKRENSCN